MYSAENHEDYNMFLWQHESTCNQEIAEGDISENQKATDEETTTEQPSNILEISTDTVDCRNCNNRDETEVELVRTSVKRTPTKT